MLEHCPLLKPGNRLDGWPDKGLIPAPGKSMGGGDWLKPVLLCPERKAKNGSIVSPSVSMLLCVDFFVCTTYTCLFARMQHIISCCPSDSMINLVPPVAF